jgi:hypothetical protein
MPVSWTSLGGVVLATPEGDAPATRSPFLWEDLMRLADLVESLCQVDFAGDGK